MSLGPEAFDMMQGIQITLPMGFEITLRALRLDRAAALFSRAHAEVEVIGLQDLRNRSERQGGRGHGPNGGLEGLDGRLDLV